jgi:hypothetical protein
LSAEKERQIGANVTSAIEEAEPDWHLIARVENWEAEETANLEFRMNIAFTRREN